MALTATERRVIAALADGLPLVAHPYAALAERLGLDEAAVIAILDGLVARGDIARLGLVVRHHELGYGANAMAVWDVPDDRVAAVGHRLAARPEVTLCYRRPRRPPIWRYNLFAMVHGRDRATVRARVAALSAETALESLPHDILFSRRRFKQCGARYEAPGKAS